jgi:hypothetical protein
MNFVIPSHYQTQVQDMRSLKNLVYFTKLLTQTFLKDLADGNTKQLCGLVVI